MSEKILKPLVVFDIETTGLHKETDYIIQFSALKIDRISGNIIDSLDLYIRPVGEYTITIQAYLKHHIKPADLADKPTFGEVAEKIKDFIEGCDILTYNGCSFDIPFLKYEFLRVGIKIDFNSVSLYDAFLEEKRRHGNNLEAVYERYTGKSMEDAGLVAHNAFSDIQATWEVFKKQQEIQEYGPEEILTEDNVIVLSDFNGKNMPIFNIGKYKGLPLTYISSIDKEYISWCLSDKCNFIDSTKDYIKNFVK